MAPFRVVLDACVLLPQTLCDVLLSLADAGLFRPLWTSDLLDEVERNLSGPRFAKTPAQASRRVRAMRTAFPLAEQETNGYGELIAAMTNDPKDRHVLAAAVRSGAAAIVTYNRKDFPAAAVEPFDVEVLGPDAFLCDQLDLDPGNVRAGLLIMLARNRIPPRDMVQLIDSLRDQTPHFATALLALVLSNDPVGNRESVHIRGLMDERSVDRIRRNSALPAVPPIHASFVNADVDLSLVVERALFMLPPEQRAAIVAVDMEGYSMGDAAAALGVSDATLRSRCASARQNLAVALQSGREEDPDG